MSRVLVWDKSFLRAFKRVTKRDRSLRERIFSTLKILEEDPYHQTLDTHKLKGELDGLWACSVDYDCRIVFDFVKENTSKKEYLLLIDIGTHDEVY